MHHTETVGNEEVPEGRVFRRQFLARSLVLRLLTGLEPDILQQSHLTIAKRLDGGLRGGADDIGGELHLHAEELTETGCYRGKGELRIRFSLGTPEMSENDDAGSSLAQLVEGG